MKAKLLKKVRKKFRIVEDGLGEQHLQRKGLFGWEFYRKTYEFYLIDPLFGYNDEMGLLRAILYYRYSKYLRKKKVEKQKSKQLTKIWHNDNTEIHTY